MNEADILNKSAEVIARLRNSCKGQPAEIPWPHRVLHDAIDCIEELDRQVRQLSPADTEPVARVIERRFGGAVMAERLKPVELGTLLYAGPLRPAVPEGMVMVEVATPDLRKQMLVSRDEIQSSNIKLPGVAADRAWREIEEAIKAQQPEGGDE